MGRTRLGNWRRRTRHEQVEASTRWTLVALPWLMTLSGTGQLLAQGEGTPDSPALLLGTVALSLLGCCLASWAVGPALDTYMGAGHTSRTRTAVRVLGAVFAVQAVLLVVHVTRGALRDGSGVGLVVFSSSVPFFVVAGLALSLRTVLLLGTGTSAGFALVFAGVGAPLPIALVAGLLGFVGATAAVLSSRGSGWYVAVLHELDTARESQARLAVVDERLRFSRDLHDVMGRNLAAIALKSELAVRLARHGDDAAAAQMAEVQHLAQESQREVREVVRGYRETGLVEELDGARAVLKAADIDCRFDTAGGEHLSPSLQTALAWAVREGTTNVLRHADARHCTVRLRVTDRATLVMENDGAAPPDRGTGGGGTGLKGLRERLAPLGGTLETRAQPGGHFRLCVELPVHDAEKGPA